MTRADFLMGLATSAGSLALPTRPDTQPPAGPSAQKTAMNPMTAHQPNIIYLVAHDLGRHLGCYGTRVHSPNLDRIAADGARLDRYFCAAAVCSPSRGCAMTGLHAHANGIMGLTHFGWRYHPGVRTAPEYLRDLGYETIRTGYSHEGDEGNPQRRYDTDLAVTWRKCRSENAIDDAVAFLKNRRESPGPKRPFYLNIGVIEVHPSAYLQEYDAHHRRAGRLPYSYGGPIPPEQVSLPPDMPDTPAARAYLAKFEAAIRFLDAQVGRLYDQYLQLGYGADTLFIFTTDHGMNGPRGKGSLYDHGLGIAGLVRPPDPVRRPGMAVPHLLQNLDVVPTLIEAAGGKPPTHLHGRSFWPVFTGGEYQPHSHLVAEWNCGGGADEYHPVRTLRSGRYRYIRHLSDWIPARARPEDWDPPEIHAPGPQEPWPRFTLKPPGSAREELYDAESDPAGLRDLVREPAHANTLCSMAATLDAWMLQVNDPARAADFQPTMPRGPGFDYIPDGSGL